MTIIFFNFQIESFIKGFKLSSLTYKRVMHLLHEEMKRGLCKKSHGRADIKMFPTFVRSLPDGSGQYVFRYFFHIQMTSLKNT